MNDIAAAKAPDDYARTVYAGTIWMALAWTFHANQGMIAAHLPPSAVGAVSVLLWVGFAVLTLALFYLLSIGDRMERRIAWAARLWVPLTLAVCCIAAGIHVFDAFRPASFVPCLMMLSLGLFAWTGVHARWPHWVSGLLCLAGAVASLVLPGHAGAVLALVCVLLLGVARAASERYVAAA